MNDSDKKSGEQKHNENLLEDVCMLNEKFENFQKVTKSSKWINRLMLILVGATFIIGISILFTPFFFAFKHPEPYKMAIANATKSYICPKLLKETAIMINSVGPELFGLIGERVMSKLPEAGNKVEEEWNLMVKNLTVELENQLDIKREKIYEQLEKLLIHEFPTLADAEKADIILVNAHKATGNVFDMIYQKYLIDHTEEVTKLFNRIEVFPIPEHIQKMENKELIDYLFDIMGLYASQSIKTSMSPNMKRFLQSLEELKINLN